MKCKPNDAQLIKAKYSQNINREMIQDDKYSQDIWVYTGLQLIAHKTLKMVISW